ncbi:cGMP-specific 3',5'-cyclic phosphodiesterase [Bulinus truncatus]|nr:cGMP-specific 3',5'-cyclic phosphodiesterase [Bulinus truncatus]
MYSTVTVQLQYSYSTVTVRLQVLFCSTVIVQFQLQYSYSTVTVQLQYSYSTVTVQLQYSYSTVTVTVQLQYSYSTVTVQLQYSYSTVAVQLQYSCSTVAVQLQYSCSTVAVQLQYSCSTVAVRLQYGYSTVTVQLQYSYGTVTVQLRHSYGTVTAQLRYSYGTVTAQLRHSYGTVAVRLQYGYGTVTVRLRYGCSTVTTLNIEDLSKDGRFVHENGSDDPGFLAKSVLCMPIHNSDRTIIGVTQLINKVNGQPFDENDEHIIEAFSIFTGLGIHNCQMYENACQLMAKQSVALEVLSYHATASKEEAERIMVERIPASEEYKLYRYDFDDKLMTDDDTLKATIRMFLDANLISQFKVPYETMCRWVCTVRKNYRPVTYHNWRHAFNVCQTMFTMLYTGELRPKFDAVEVFALMAACLCHDLDHRGTNNAFQVKVASPLAMLYSTSVLEHHHFDHCIMIINSEGNNIFQSFPPEEYRRAIKILEHAILSTDLALYFKKRGDFKNLVENGEREFQEENKKDLLKAMMMTACDVAAITKPWKIQKEIAQLVTAEFFEQGDIEKTQLGEKPIPMMDREKKDELPKMQVDFIDFICSPVYEAFAKMFPSLGPLYEGLLSNRRNWSQLANNEYVDDLAISPAPSSTKLTSDSVKVKSKSNAKKVLRSPKSQRSPMLLRKSPLTTRRLSDPPETLKRDGHKVKTVSPFKDCHGLSTGRGKTQGKSSSREGQPGILFAKVSESLKPLNDGCQDNRQHWQELSHRKMQHKSDVPREDTNAGEKPKESQARREFSHQGNNETHKDNRPGLQDTALTRQLDQKPKQIDVHSVNIEYQPKIYSNAHAIPQSQIQAEVKGESKCKKSSTKHVETRKSTKSSKSHFCSIS